jgi:amino acid transporter
MNKYEKFTLLIGVIFLSLSVLIITMAHFNYFLILDRYDNSVYFVFLFLVISFAGFLTFGLYFWTRKSKDRTKHKKFDKILRCVSGIAGFTVIAASLYIFFLLTHLTAEKTYFDNANYNIVVEHDGFGNMSSITVFKKVVPLLKKEVYSNDWFDSIGNGAIVKLYRDYVVFTYYYEGDGDIGNKPITEKHYFSEWK